MPPELTPEAWTQVRYEYEHTDKPVEDICIDHGVSAGTLRDRMRRWRWTRRRPPIPAQGPPPAPAAQIEHAAPLVPIAPQSDAAAPFVPDAARIETVAGLAAPLAAPEDSDPAVIVPRLQNAVARLLPAIEAIVAKLAAQPLQVREMERGARALAGLTRTLRESITLLGQYPVPTPDDEPENLEEFRLRLARKIDAIIARRPGGDPQA